MSAGGRGYHADRVIIDEPFVSPEAYADDELIDALSSARLGNDTELVFQLLAEWRRELHAESARQLVTAERAGDILRRAFQS